MKTANPPLHLPAPARFVRWRRQVNSNVCQTKERSLDPKTRQSCIRGFFWIGFDESGDKIDAKHDGAEVDECGIVPGPVMTMQLVMDIALGDDETCRYYYDELRKHAAGGSQQHAADGAALRS
jgi:hypothetical protein